MNSCNFLFSSVVIQLFSQYPPWNWWRVHTCLLAPVPKRKREKWKKKHAQVQQVALLALVSCCGLKPTFLVKSWKPWNTSLQRVGKCFPFAPWWLGCFGRNKKNRIVKFQIPANLWNLWAVFGVLYNSIPKEGPVQSKQGSIWVPCGGFLKWYPTTIGFPTKNDHFGVFWGCHHFRKHPCIQTLQSSSRPSKITVPSSCWLSKSLT